MAVKFDKRWFNPLYFIINELAKDDGIRLILVYGGKSSGKTLAMCQFLAKECYVKGSNALACRKESAIIPTTLKKSFNLAVESMYLSPAFEVQDRRYLCRNQGGSSSEIVLKGLDTPEKAKGIEGYKYLYLDELNHFEQADFEQFNLSLRGIRGQKILASWNPVDEGSWVKTGLVDQYEFGLTGLSPALSKGEAYRLPGENSFVRRSGCGRVILIKTNYEDNYWIVGSPAPSKFPPEGETFISYGYRDENLVAEYEALRTKNFNSYKVNVLGEWGKTTYGGEFLKSWRSELHTGEHAYDPDCAIYLWFDENVVPYFPCGVFQLGSSGNRPRMIYHIAARSPNNKVPWVCAELRRKLTEWGHTGRVYIGGDATSQREDVKQEAGHDLFRLIMNELRDFRPERRVQAGNPSVVMSGNFLNSILEGGVPGLTYGVDRRCITAILDYEKTKEDKNGKIDKKTVFDKTLQTSYQPYGHFVDLTRYFLTSVYAQEYYRYQKGPETVRIATGKIRKKYSY